MRALLMVAFAFLTSVAVPPTVLAGTYDVWTCQAPSGLPAPIAGWSPEGGGAVNDCAGRQGLKAALPGSALPAKAFTGWRFDAPAGTPIRDYELFRVAVTIPARTCVHAPTASTTTSRSGNRPSR